MIRVAITTFPDEPAAAEAVRTLVTESLAACGTILPGARSIYRWQSKIEETTEVVVIFKLATAQADTFSKRFQSLHPYDVPELILLNPEAVDPAYERWVLG